ncbi:Gfo/Idh/MocA family oxidoreductase [Candidatus Peregrinibacteria bacterium]|nr:Gfo/Idh/MocA family oxidoreductase [Candidatus Peregrinibacteria bacterium]
MNLKPLRFGVIGLGFGANIHVPALKMLKGVQVVAIAGRDLTKVRLVAKKFDIPVACATLKDFFQQKLDAITIALPPSEAEKAISMAFKKGVPVLAEKPLSISLKSALKLEKLAKGNIAGIDFQFAELDVFKKLKEIIDSKKFGNVRHVQIVWMVYSAAHRKKEWSWKVDAKRGGGVISLLGSHMFYLIEWLFGPVTGLLASSSSKETSVFSPKGSSPAEDLVSIIFNHPKIAKIAATISNASPSGIGHRWEIVFDSATVILHNPTFDYMSGFALKIRKGEHERKILIPKVPRNIDGRIKPFRSLAHRFVKAVKSKKQFMPNFTVGLRVQKLMEACYNSSGGNKYIRI